MLILHHLRSNIYYLSIAKTNTNLDGYQRSVVHTHTPPLLQQVRHKPSRGGHRTTAAQSAKLPLSCFYDFDERLGKAAGALSASEHLPQ